MLVCNNLMQQGLLINVFDIRDIIIIDRLLIFRKSPFYFEDLFYIILILLRNIRF